MEGTSEQPPSANFQRARVVQGAACTHTRHLSNGPPHAIASFLWAETWSHFSCTGVTNPRPSLTHPGPTRLRGNGRVWKPTLVRGNGLFVREKTAEMDSAQTSWGDVARLMCRQGFDF